MSFDSIETSREDGRPIVLYQFTLGTTIWRYTSADRTQLFGGFTWLRANISDDAVKQSGDVQADMLNIDAPTTIGPVQMAMTTPPSEAIQVAILHAHVGEEPVVVYGGLVKQVSFLQPGQARIMCEMTSASMQRDGLRLPWQRGCPYSVYDPLTCKVDKAAFGLALLVLSINNFTVTTNGANAKPDGWFAGGFMEWDNPVRGTVRRAIESHTGNDVEMFGVTDDLYVGVAVTLYPGCSRTFSICGSKFNNQDNYGGVPNMPGKSPFDGTPVF